MTVFGGSGGVVPDAPGAVTPGAVVALLGVVTVAIMLPGFVGFAAGGTGATTGVAAAGGTTGVPPKGEEAGTVTGVGAAAMTAGVIPADTAGAVPPIGDDAGG